MPAKKHKDEKNITVWGDPKEKVAFSIEKPMANGNIKRVKLLSGYGDVSYRQWCELELKRMKSTTDNVRIIERKSDGFIALARVR